jgi:hypothetical protein
MEGYLLSGINFSSSAIQNRVKSIVYLLVILWYSNGKDTRSVPLSGYIGHIKTEGKEHEKDSFDHGQIKLPNDQ